MSCEAEFFGGREVLNAFLTEEWLHSQTNQTGHKSTHSITNCQQSQGKLSLVGRNVPRDGVGRVQDYHPCDEAKSGTESDDDPDVPHEMVPRLEQKKDYMCHFQCCNDNNNSKLNCRGWCLWPPCEHK